MTPPAPRIIKARSPTGLSPSRPSGRCLSGQGGSLKAGKWVRCPGIPGTIGSEWPDTGSLESKAGTRPAQLVGLHRPRPSWSWTDGGHLDVDRLGRPAHRVG